jgi:hypothetical protein
MGSAGEFGAEAEDRRIGGEQAPHPGLGFGRVVVPVPDELAVRDPPGLGVAVPAFQPVDHPGAGEAVVVLPVRLDPGERDAVGLGRGHIAVQLDQQVGQVVAGPGARVGQRGGDAVDIVPGRAGEQAAVVLGRARQVARAQRGHVAPVDGPQVAGQQFGDLLLVEQILQGGHGRDSTASGVIERGGER